MVYDGSFKFNEDMAAVGVEASSPWDLVPLKTPYPAAIPVLLQWLERADTEVPTYKRRTFREGVVRALTVREARGVAAPALIREFRRPDTLDRNPWAYRWVVGNALSVVADANTFSDLVNLAKDRSYGRGREMLMDAIASTGHTHAVPVLIEMLRDEDVAGHAVSALRKSRDKRAAEAAPYVEPLLRHPKAWIRTQAQKALKKWGQ